MGSRHRVLVIDDEAPIRSALEDMLTDEGYDVRTAPDGRQGLAVLAGWMPDIILLDLSMPVMGGAAFREAQLGLPGDTRDVPIVALTGFRDAADRAREIGAVAVLVKPFDLDDLDATVDQVLKLGSRN